VVSNGVIRLRVEDRAKIDRQTRDLKRYLLVELDELRMDSASLTPNPRSSIGLLFLWTEIREVEWSSIDYGVSNLSIYS
jgi:hypothetical protein